MTMYLRGYPKYYVKDGKRRPVYYTADARDLTAKGWRPEEEKTAEVHKPAQAEKVSAPVEQPKPVEKIEVEVIEDAVQEPKLINTDELPDFEFMTKPELLEYAMNRGVDLPNNALKAELVKACRELVDD